MPWQISCNGVGIPPLMVVGFQIHSQEKAAREHEKDVSSQNSRAGAGALSKREVCEDATIICCTDARAPRKFQSRTPALLRERCQKEKPAKMPTSFLHWCSGPAEISKENSRGGAGALSKREACDDAIIISCTGARAPRIFQRRTEACEHANIISCIAARAAKKLRRRGQAKLAAGAQKKNKEARCPGRFPALMLEILH